MDQGHKMDTELDNWVRLEGNYKKYVFANSAPSDHGHNQGLEAL